jgi:hypothetical protein
MTSGIFPLNPNHDHQPLLHLSRSQTHHLISPISPPIVVSNPTYYCHLSSNLSNTKLISPSPPYHNFYSLYNLPSITIVCLLYQIFHRPLFEIIYTRDLIVLPHRFNCRSNHSGVKFNTTTHKAATVDTSGESSLVYNPHPAPSAMFHPFELIPSCSYHDLIILFNPSVFIQSLHQLISLESFYSYPSITH